VRPFAETSSATPTVINLTVHGVGVAARSLDPGEDRIWVSLDQFERVIDAVANRPDVHLTFDDSNESDVTLALPRLLERGIRAEFFVLAGLLGRAGRLDASGVTTLVAAGMSIGSHGWAHRDWRRVNDREAHEEFVEAARVLGGLIGGPVSRVAIPFGSYDRHVLRRLRHVGATQVYSGDGGWARSTSWLQARTSLPHNLDAAWVSRVLAPGTPAQRARRLVARNMKRWRGRP
jgi:peptidoglycan/xylan/chitin deacetylase (PgdA/CDA1 family)